LFKKTQHAEAEQTVKNLAESGLLKAQQQNILPKSLYIV
jgi:hypothetical protein